MDKKPYDKIYLIGWYPGYPRPVDYGDGVTWCQDPIGNNNTEYVRADLVTAKDARISELEGKVARLEKAMSYMDLPVDTRLRILVREALKE